MPKGATRQKDGSFAVRGEPSRRSAASAVRSAAAAATAAPAPAPTAGHVIHNAAFEESPEFRESPEYHAACRHFQARMTAEVEKQRLENQQTKCEVAHVGQQVRELKAQHAAKDAMLAKADADIAVLRRQMADLQRLVASGGATKQQRPTCPANTLSLGMVIRRLPEGDDETTPQLETKVLNVFGDCCINKSRISSMQRIGRMCPDRPRPVLVVFKDMEMKLGIKRLGYKLAGKSISLDHALSKDQMRQRAAQWPLIKAAKENGMKWSWSDHQPEKLIVQHRWAHHAAAAAVAAAKTTTTAAAAAATTTVAAAGSSNVEVVALTPPCKGGAVGRSPPSGPKDPAVDVGRSPMMISP